MASWVYIQFHGFMILDLPDKGLRVLPSIYAREFRK